MTCDEDDPDDDMLVNPIFYVPLAPEAATRDTLTLNELRLLSSDEICELIVDTEMEIEARERQEHNDESRWDLSGYNMVVLSQILKHAKSMNEMLTCGLISTEAEPPKATATVIGSLFKRLGFY